MLRVAEPRHEFWGKPQPHIAKVRPMRFACSYRHVREGHRLARACATGDDEPACAAADECLAPVPYDRELGYECRVGLAVSRGDATRIQPIRLCDTEVFQLAEAGWFLMVR